MGIAILIVYIPLFVFFGIIALFIGLKINDKKLTKTNYYILYLSIGIITSTIAIIYLVSFVRFHGNADFNALITQVAITLVAPIVCGIFIVFISLLFKNDTRSIIKIFGTGTLYSVFAIPWVGLFIGMYGNSLVNLVANYSDYTRLCKNAKIVIYEKVDTAKSIAFYSDQIPRVQNGTYVEFSPLADSIVRDYKIDFIERPLIQNKDYLKNYLYIRKSKTVINAKNRTVKYESIGENEITAEYIVVSTSIRLDKENKLGIGGNKLEIIRRTDNKLIAHAQYYWDAKNSRACPDEANLSGFIDNFLQDSLNIKKVIDTY